MALANWNLPEPIQTAVLLHHRPLSDVPIMHSTPNLMPLSHLVAAANHYVNGSGITVQDQLRECDLESKVTLDSFGLTAEQKEAVLRDFDAEFKAIAGFFH